MDSTESTLGLTEQVPPAERVAGPAAESEAAPETAGHRFSRRAHRTRLYLYAAAAAVLLVFLIALAVANTRRVGVSWVFGSSSVSLVWLVLFSAFAGVLLGMVVGALFHRSTRRPRG